MSVKNEKFIIMNPKDNCATALKDISKDSEIKIKGKSIKINQEVLLGHKFALSNMNKGELVKKYGEIIGITTQDIKAGDWIHTHNIKSHYLEEVKK